MSSFKEKPLVQKVVLQAIGLVVGIIIGTFLVFQILFLMKVIPHGGL